MAVSMYSQPVLLFNPPAYLAEAPPSSGWFMAPPPPKFQGPHCSIPRARREGGYKKRRGSGGFDVGPNLHQLQTENRKKARRYFKGSFGQTPRRSVPRAPKRSPSVLLQAPGSVFASPLGGPGFHAVTPNPFKPGTAWKNGLGTVDKEAADIGKTMGIDIFGSNAGLITAKNETDSEAIDADSSDIEDPFGFELHLNDVEGPVPASARAQIEEQQAYIAQLEELSLNLQEKLFIAEQQVRQMRSRLASGAMFSPSGLQSSPSEELDHRGSIYGHSEDEHNAPHLCAPNAHSEDENSHMTGI